MKELNLQECKNCTGAKSWIWSTILTFTGKQSGYAAAGIAGDILMDAASNIDWTPGPQVENRTWDPDQPFFYGMGQVAG